MECGIDGVIIPDLPFRDYEKSYKAIASKYDIRVIMLITPETSEARVREIDAHTDGFIYLVSSAATTGAQKDFDTRKQAYFKKIEDMNLRNPRMVGFGISNKQTFDAALRPLIRCHYRQPLRHAAQREGRRCGKGYQAVEGRFETVSLFKFHTIYFSQ